MNLPYSITNFDKLRRERYFYADKTRFLGRLEDKRRGRNYVVFLRPRRFGKSTFLSLLEHYYDVLRKDDFEALFSGLDVFAQPTPDRHRYLVLKLDFSSLTTNAGLQALQDSFHDRLRGQLQSFIDRYAALLPSVVARWPQRQATARSPGDLMSTFLLLLEQAPHQLYLLVDEYDRFVNDLVAHGDDKTYRDILSPGGFVRQFYDAIKAATDKVVDRIFITGVAPIMATDLASTFNIASLIALDDDFHDLCGFSQAEVEQLLDLVLSTGGYTLSRAQVLDDLRRYYDGYRFSGRTTELLYNPEMVLYFLKGLALPAQYPDDLLDKNLRSDYTRLRPFLFTPEGQPRGPAIEQVRTVLSGGEITSGLHSMFRLDQIVGTGYFASYLYHLGLVTISERTLNQYRLRVPNVVIREIYGDMFDYILRGTAQVEVDKDELSRAVAVMAEDGQLGPFLSFIDERVLSRLSQRDLIRMDERALKVVLLAYLLLSELYYPFSEMELGRGYGDLILALNRRQPEARYSLLLELKYLPATEAKAGKGARGKRPAAALAKQIEARFGEAEEQLRRYLADPRLKAVEGPDGWRAYAVVQVGTRGLYYRELSQPTVTLRAPHRRARAKG